MSNGIGVPKDDDGSADTGRRLVPMRIGEATVFVEALDADEDLVDEEEIRPVAATLKPSEAFATANEALRECVRVVGARLTDFGDAVAPSTITVEFTLTFDVEGRAHIIPVLVTGKAKSSVGLKVTAQWQLGEDTR